MVKNISISKLKTLLTASHSYHLILFIVSLILFLIPIIFWFNKLYYVGGDDTLLYYMYPQEMIRNYIFNIASDNVLSGIGSYSAQFYQLPFFSLIAFVKLLIPNINTQSFFYGLNLSLGFLFFYFFLGIWIKNSSPYNYFLKILGGLVYVFSIFSYYSLWQSLFTPYLVSGFPILTYLFFKGIKTENVNFIILSSLVLSLMSILLLLTPWLLIAILSVSPLLIVLFLGKKKYFVFYSFIFIFISVLLNFYWLYHLFLTYFSGFVDQKNTILDTTSNNFIASAKNTIIAVTRENNLIYPLFNLFHKNIQENGNWPNYHIFHDWHEKFIYFYFFFTAAIVYAGTRLKKIKSELKILYLSSVIGWLIILYMFTVNIGNKIGIDIFVWLVTHIPGFAMFRNVMGKIAPAYPFIYALTLIVSLKIIMDTQLKTILKKILILLAFLIVIAAAKPFIFNEYFNNSLWTTKNTYTTISGFNNEFKELTQYLNGFDSSSRFIWFPITAVNYITVRDQAMQNHFYTGLSPLQFLAKKNDIAGIMSFPLKAQSKFTENLINKKYDSIGYLLKEFNVNYIIVNNDISAELQKSYFFASAVPNLYSAQGTEFKKSLLGKKVKDFNKKYEIYEIKDIYKSEKIFLSNQSSIDTTLRFTKKKNYLYEITIKKLSGNLNLNFLERYSPFWTLYFKNSKEKLPTIKHSQIYDYANQWRLDSIQIKKIADENQYKLDKNGSIDLDIDLYFQPQSYFVPSSLVSVVTLIFILSYFIFKIFLFFNRKTASKS